MEKKQWYASKTLWTNVVAGIAALTGAVNVDLGLTPEGQTQLVVGIMALINFWLRLSTTTGVGK